MIIDQLFEDDKKKKLNEVDPRNFDSDEDYYNAVRRSKRGSYDDDDYEPEDEIDSVGDDESYYEKSLRTRGLGEDEKLDELNWKDIQRGASKIFKGAQKSMPFYGTNPTTGKAWTRDELIANADAPSAPTQASAPAAPAAPGSFNAANVMSLPGMEKYTKKPAPAKPNFGQTFGSYSNVNQPTTASYGSKPAAKPTAPAAPAVQPAAAGPGGAYNTKTGAATLGGKPMVAMKDLPPAVQKRLGAAVAENINKMFNSLESKDDVQKLKQYLDRQFVKHGLVSEGAYSVRNKLIERATHIAAVRRRENAAR